MHKCFKCGAEFEGNFCPECGTQWQEEKQCPNCGATLAGGAKFCNNCGYSFVGSAEEKRPKKEKKPSKVGAFFKKAWAWVRSHLKIVIPTACAFIVVIVVCSLIPTFILMSVNGTYYAYSFDENGEIVFNEKTYITLSTGKWTDEEGKEGSYSLSGGEITFTYIDETMEDLGDLFGEDVGPEEIKGTVENGVLTVTDNGFDTIYITKGHKHFGEWEVTKESTCTVEGEHKRVCACKKVETESVAPKGHALNRDYLCTVCGKQFTKGLGYKLSEDSSHYIVTSLGSISRDIAAVSRDPITGLPLSRVNIIILDYYNGKPVTGIGGHTFEDCAGFTDITIPVSVTSIEDGAFSSCNGSIYYAGDVASWCGISGLNNLNKRLVYINNQKLYDMTSITIPNSVTSIKSNAFSGCSRLMSITFGGTKTQWKAIEKESDWNGGTGNYTVQCTDGKLDKNGNEIAD